MKQKSLLNHDTKKRLYSMCINLCNAKICDMVILFSLSCDFGFGYFLQI